MVKTIKVYKGNAFLTSSLCYSYQNLKKEMSAGLDDREMRMIRTILITVLCYTICAAPITILVLISCCDELFYNHHNRHDLHMEHQINNSLEIQRNVEHGDGYSDAFNVVMNIEDGGQHHDHHHETEIQRPRILRSHGH